MRVIGKIPNVYWGTCYGIHYILGDPHIIGFTDSDWAGDINDHKSNFGFIFFLGSSPITWSFKKLNSHTLSYTKIEYMVVVLASQEFLWLW